MPQQRDVQRRSPYGDNPEVGERARATHEKILVSALGVFERQGFRDARMEDIAKAAQVSRATVYQYFEDKEEIYEALSVRVSNLIFDLVDELDVVDASDTGRERLRVWVGRYFDLAVTHKSLVDVWNEPARQTTGEFAALADRWLARVLDKMGKQFSLSADSILDPRLAAAAAFGMVYSAAIRAASDEWPGDVDQLVDELTSLLFRAFFASPAQPVS
jgi:AcrR family transcriptional regulator